MTPLWINKIDILYEKKYLFEIIPTKGFDFNRKLNSLLRLSIYYSIIMLLINKNKNVLLIPVGVATFTYILGKQSSKNKVDNAFSNLQNNNNQGLIQEISGDCRVPTKNNPFMNPTLFGKDNNIESCHSYNNKGVQNEIEKKFNIDLYQDSNNIFGKNNSQRQFYSVPSRKYPNDQESFKNWLYATPPTCKEGNGLQCAANQIGVRKGPGSDENN